MYAHLFGVAALAKFGDMDEVERRALEDYAGAGQAWIVAPTGGTQLASRLQKAVGGIQIDLRDRGQDDALTHFVFSITPHLSPEQRGPAIAALAEAAHLDPDVGPLVEKVAAIGKPLVLRLSDQGEIGPQSTVWSERTRLFQDALISGLQARRDVPLIVLTRRRHPSSGIRPQKLREPEVDREGLLEGWCSYAASAALLADRAGRVTGLMPIPVRLGVGAIALGAAPELVLDAVRRFQRDAVPRLVQAIVDAPRYPEVRAAVRQFLRLRAPLAIEHVEAWTGIPAVHLPLINDCIGYGDPVRMSDEVRRHFASVDRQSPAGDAASVSDAQRAHAQLGDRYAALDGAASPPLGQVAELGAWLEKTHHYALAGDERVAEWSALDLPTSELYCARGRALSRARRHAEAADVYERCVARFPEDDYAWHYLGYNRARIESRRGQAEADFRRAVALSPDNPWWNTRLVTYLIEDGAPVAAEKAWAEAVKNAEAPPGRPEGWLYGELHRWVAQSWLDVDQLAAAQRVLDAVPADLPGLDESARSDIERSRARLEDAREREAFGHAIYPPWVPIARRWLAEPELLDRFLDEGVDLVEWFPGQIIDAGSSIRVVYASPRDPPAERTTRLLVVDAAEWRAHAGWPLPKKGAFVELGTYSDGSKRIVRRPEPVS